ncbi:MAG: valine--tRNA ligase [Pseudomonadota bacterium]
MDKTYQPKNIERKHYERWEREGRFKPQGGDEAFCIVIPPPNVTGTLHMGHAFQDTIMDTLTRYQRLRGVNTLWQHGTDHAGIATQMVVERQLNAEGLSRRDLGRDAFVERVWDWKAKSGGHINGQLRRMGASVDWSRERFTMDDGLSAAVRDVFIQLHEEGLIYRGKRLVNWDPVLHTALSDLEVLSEDEQGSLWHFRYPLADDSSNGDETHLIVATTRPETMLGDTAVAVHPNDERYQHLIGKHVRLPIVDRLIPIIADDYVDPEFGTGCVKITPAHDFNDYEIGQRHNLPMINVLTDDAAINDDMPADYRGLDRFDARKKIVAQVETLELLEKIEPHTLKVPRGDRTGAVVEPYLTDQWYVKIAPLAEPAIAAVENGDIKFVPENWSKTYFDWMHKIQDWCISRQLWWGHRIPAWYDDNGNIFVGKDEADVRAKHNLSDDVNLRQDDDVLDTWFSSALWPFSTLGWPEKTQELDSFYPTSVLVTGFDIIFFWVARMIMFGLKFAGDVPFREVYIHGLIRDQDGQKMSKSKGNVLDPIDLIDGIDLESLVAKRTTGLMQPHLAPRIEKATRRQFPEGIAEFGTDALRFTFASLATTGRDIRFDLGRIEGYRNFCNKLWNASRFVLSTTETLDDNQSAEADDSLSGRWIRARFDHMVATVDRQLARYRLDLAAQAIYEFTWHEYCDWYLELSKATLYDDDAQAHAKQATMRTLSRTLEGLLRVMHPFMPFISEEIWQRVAPVAGVAGDSICDTVWPQANPANHDPSVADDMQWLQTFVLGVRQIRGEMDIAPGKALDIILVDASADDRARFAANKKLIMKLANLADADFLPAGDSEPPSATAMHGEMKICVPMAGLIDVEREIERLTKQLGKSQADLAKTQGKLSNASFVERAPADVVATEKQRAQEHQQQIELLEAQLDALAKLESNDPA